MNNRLKQSVAAASTLVLAGSLLAACGGKDDTTPASTGSQAGSPPVTLSMMIATHNSWPYKEDWKIYKWYKEKTNIDFKIEAPPNDYTTAVNLAISSGALPDLMNVTGLTAANKYGSSGAFVNILDHLDKLPNYKKFLEQHPEVKETVLSADGKSYLFPVYGLDKQSRRSWIYREDIFVKHGLKPPTTYEELYTVAKKLKELYPGSFPIGLFDNLGPLNNMTYGFGTSNGTYYDFDKKEWLYGPIENSYKELVTYMNKFYKEGLIPPDFMALKRKQWQDLFTQNKSFIGNDYIGSIDEIVSDNKEFNLNFMVPPKGGPNGVAKNLNNGFITTGFAISSTSKKQDAAFRFMDFLYSPEGIEIASWGKEGETYTVENGKKKFKPEVGDFTKLRQQFGFSTYGTYAVLDMEGFFSTFTPKMQTALKNFDQYEAKMQPRVAYTDAENEQLTAVNDSISKFKEEQVAKFILGQRPLSEWDAYVAEFKKLGIQKVLDINKTAYERTLKFVQQK